MKKFFSSNHSLIFINNFKGWGKGIPCPFCNSEICEFVIQWDKNDKPVGVTRCGGTLTEENYTPDYISFEYTKIEEE